MIKEKINVIQFNIDDDKNVWRCIKTFLDRVEQNSKNTRVSYEKAIRDFFLTMRGKKLEDLIEQDLIFKKPQIETYQVNLRNTFKATTVNSRMSGLKKCYTKLKEYEFNVNDSWFELDRYSEHEKDRYSPMTYNEVVKSMELVSKTRKGSEKKLLLRLAFATAFRKESLLNLKWTDLSYQDDVWVIKTLGKGNEWDYKKVSDGLYDELMKQKELIDGEKIFQLTSKTVNKMMNHIRDNIDFGDRKITFHSLKKSSIDAVATLTNYDLKIMQRQGNHASITTTLNDYMENKKLDDLIVVDIDYNVPIEKVEELSKGKLVDLIKSLDRNSQVKLLKKMGAM